MNSEKIDYFVRRRISYEMININWRYPVLIVPRVSSKSDKVEVENTGPFDKICVRKIRR